MLKKKDCGVCGGDKSKPSKASVGAFLTLSENRYMFSIKDWL